MNKIQELRSKIANDLGVELTPEETEESVSRIFVLAELVRGVDWGWLRDVSTPGKMLMSWWRMNKIVGDFVPFEEFERTRTIILLVDDRVNPKPKKEDQT